MATQTKADVSQDNNFDHIVNDVCVGPNCGSIELVGSVKNDSDEDRKEVIIETLVELEMQSEDA